MLAVILGICSVLLSMASTEFCEAVAYAIRCVGLKDLTLKPKQKEALIHLYGDHDVFVWFPTGYGKSLCFQLLTSSAGAVTTSVSDNRPGLSLRDSQH